MHLFKNNIFYQVLSIIQGELEKKERLLSIAQKANIVIVVNGMRVYVTLLDHIG
jgi:hypothetical protein